MNKNIFRRVSFLHEGIGIGTLLLTGFALAGTVQMAVELAKYKIDKNSDKKKIEEGLKALKKANVKI